MLIVTVGEGDRMPKATAVGPAADAARKEAKRLKTERDTERTFNRSPKGKLKAKLEKDLAEKKTTPKARSEG